MAGKNGNGEQIPTPLEKEKAAVKRLLKAFHPDRMANAPAKDKEALAEVQRILSAFVDIHGSKKLIAESGWPENTPAPKQLALVSFGADGTRYGVKIEADGFVTPKQCFDEIAAFNDDPAGYVRRTQEDVRARTQARAARHGARTQTRTTADDLWDAMARGEREAQSRRDYAEAERARQADAAERSQRAAREEAERRAAAERAAEERRTEEASRAEALRQKEAADKAQDIADRDALKQAIKDRFGLELEVSSMLSPEEIMGSRARKQNNADIRDAISELESIGSAVSYLRGFQLSVFRFGPTEVLDDFKIIRINLNQRKDITGILLAAVQRIRARQEEVAAWNAAWSELEKMEPLKFAVMDFQGAQSADIAAFAHAIGAALARTSHASVLSSGLVLLVMVRRSKIDDTHVRFKLTRSDPTKKTVVELEAGIKATEGELTKAFDEVGAEILKSYPIELRGPLMVPIALARIEKTYGIAFSKERGDPQAMAPERRAQFIERLEAALEDVPSEDRHWLRNMTVMPANEGTRILGRAVGKREAWVKKNQFFAPFDVTKANILKALMSEITKKKEA